MVRCGLVVAAAAAAAMVVAVTGETSSLTENVDPAKVVGSGREEASPHSTMANEETKEEKRRRTEKMRAKVHSKLRPDKSQLTRLTEEEMDMAAAKAAEGDPNDPHLQWFRRTGYNDNDAYSSNLADMGAYYDYWQQGYRMLGAFIDCDNSWSQDDRRQLGDSGDGQVNYYACSRWMMWAAYVDPNYQGGGYYEYHSYNDNTQPVGKLDCHSPDTEWQLLGVYRQEFYQFLEQISKHLWAINEYEYVVALAGLAYMTNYECTYLGADENGNSVYSGIQPLSGGAYQIGLYKDQQCLELNTDTSKNYDSYGLTNDMYLGSKDDEEYDDDTFYNTAYGYWQSTQEYTLANLNDVYEQFKYCTLCIDYPTYQDGFLIGDTGMADDDLINQCWKFHSHDSFTCETDCIALGDAQGTIVEFQYAGKTFGSSWDGSSGGMYSGSSHDSSSSSESSNAPFLAMDRIMANLFLTLSGILFVITFIAFAIARGSRSTSSSSERSRALLDEDEKARAAGSSRRSKSRRREGESRSKSRSGDRRSKSASRREGERRSKSSSRRDSERRSNSRSRRSGRDESGRSSSKRASSRRHYDDF